MKTKIAKIRYQLYNFYMATYFLFAILLLLVYSPFMNIKNYLKKLLIMISNTACNKLLSFIQTK